MVKMTAIAYQNMEWASNIDFASVPTDLESYKDRDHIFQPFLY